jgi:hypothetical protein
VPPEPRAYKTKTKNAQEAHEAVRPTNPAVPPARLPPGVGADMRRLYDLIWRRALACQMENAETLQVQPWVSEGGVPNWRDEDGVRQRRPSLFGLDLDWLVPVMCEYSTVLSLVHHDMYRGAHELWFDGDCSI